MCFEQQHHDRAQQVEDDDFPIPLVRGVEHLAVKKPNDVVQRTIASDPAFEHAETERSLEHPVEEDSEVEVPIAKFEARLWFFHCWFWDREHVDSRTGMASGDGGWPEWSRGGESNSHGLVGHGV